MLGASSAQGQAVRGVIRIEGKMLHPGVRTLREGKLFSIQGRCLLMIVRLSHVRNTWQLLLDRVSNVLRISLVNICLCQL